MSAVTRTEEWPSRADTTGSGTPISRSSEACVWRSECRLVPFGSFSFRNRRDTEAETESGFSMRAIGIREHQVEVGPVIRTELLAEAILLLAVGLERDEHRVGQA